ncbi:MAG: Hint domain-containing protein [Thermoanaerobaculia bacterium]|nr:Hint domain-containing protein [Thermoanaerobaculia bacterium]
MNWTHHPDQPTASTPSLDARCGRRSRRRVHELLGPAILGVLSAATLLPATAQGAGDLTIVTYPVGLVSGQLPIQMDLGATGTPATLFLDGEKVCEATPQVSTCTVDLGTDPHVHLLELVRPAASGRDVERSFRWINRPGQEAELLLRLSPADGQGKCRARVYTNHPQKQHPAVLEVNLDGQPLTFESDGSAIVPCPQNDVSRIVVASAIFPDGRRVEDVRLIGGYVGRAESELTALPVLSDAGGSCDSVQWPDDVVRVEEGGYEVVIVLDPDVPYQSIFKTGWHIGSGSSTTSTDKAFDTFIGTEDSDMRPLATWQRAEVPFQTAEKLWYVAPGQGLPRINGFSAGKKNWLQLLFKFGMSDFQGNPTLADAVASSGLVAGAGPRRRAVVLILSNKSKDDSRYTPQQAMDYLAEVGVPLVVLRAGKSKGDGWPEGMKNANMSSMAGNLEEIMEMLEHQCVAWFEGGSRRPSQLAAELPAGFHVAGHGDVPPETQWDTLSATELAEIAGLEAEPEAPRERQFTGRLDLVSVTVLVSAEDRDGNPVEDLTVGDLVVTEDGQPVNVVKLEKIPIGSASVPGRQEGSTTPEAVDDDVVPLPVSLYIDPTLSGRLGLRVAVKALAENAARLTSVGPVEVVLGTNQAETVLADTRDASELAAFLSSFETPPPSRPSIEDIRQRYIRDIRQQYAATSGTSRREDGPSVTTAPAIVKMQTLAAAGEEYRSIEASFDTLSDWVQSKELGVPRLLVLVGTGFDENPNEFYLPMVQNIEPQNVPELRSRFQDFQQGSEVLAAAEELAGNSWRVITVATGSTGAATTNASERGGERFQAFMTDGDSGSNLDPGFLTLDPIGAQKRVARPSGGDVAMGAKGLGSALAGASGWYRMTYQAERTPDGKSHTFQATTPRDIEVKTTEVVVSESSEGRATNRLRHLLDGGSEHGMLPVEGSVSGLTTKGKRTSGTLEVKTDLGQLQELMQSLGGSVFRVSVLIAPEGQEWRAAHQVVTLEPMAGFIHSLPIEWTTGAVELAVGVEDLTSGDWGGTLVDLGGG